MEIGGKRCRTPNRMFLQAVRLHERYDGFSESASVGLVWDGGEDGCRK